jgi:hypothetical protein
VYNIFDKLTLGVCSALLCTGVISQAAPIVFSASGANPAAIQTTVDGFRTALGTLNANVAGSFPSGRREVNWDGVPDAFSAPNAFPANFFNSNSPRGVVFGTPGSGFQVSSNAAVGMVEFDNINPAYASIFQVFSSPRLFTSLGSNISDVTFFVPGSTIPASTTGFGAVFTDVDLSATTTLQFFNPGGSSIGTFPVPAANNGLSFLGVNFDAGEQISRVRITSGNTALGPNESGGVDVVAMDDFIYAEPAATIPEPSTWTLLCSAACTLLVVRRRR